MRPTSIPSPADPTFRLLLESVQTAALGAGALPLPPGRPVQRAQVDDIRRLPGWHFAERMKATPASPEERRQAAMPAVHVHMAGEIGLARTVSKVSAWRTLGTARPFQPVKVTLSSNGGAVDEAFSIARLLLRHPGDTTVTVLGNAHSAATIIVAAGDHRIAAEGCRFLFHLSALPAEDRRLTATVLGEMAPRLRYEDRNFDAFMHRRTGAPLARITALSRQDRMLTAREALSVGLLTGVRPS